MHDPTIPSFSQQQTRLIVGRQSRDLADALWSLVEDVQRNDVLAPLTVVAPTRYAGLSLRQQLGRRGFANVRFIVLPVLAELLGAAALEQQGRKPLTSVLETLSLRRVLDQTTGPLAQVREHPSTQFSVRNAFDLLRNTDGGVQTALAARGGLAGEVARMHHRFRELVSGEWYDSQDLAESAAVAILTGEAPGLDDLGLIVFYLPREASLGEARLMEALARENRCAVLIGATGDEIADASTEQLAARLQRTMGQRQELGGDSQSLPVLPGSAQLHIAPNAHEEIRWVIRQVVAEAEDKGTPPHRMAILYRMADPYAALIRDEFRMAGIPMAGPDQETLSNTAVGRTLRGLLTLSEGRFQRSDVMAWLSGCPVGPRGIPDEEFNPSQWDSISRKAGIVGGLEQWRTRLQVHSHRLAMDADHREQAAEISVARARGMRSEAAASRSLLAFIEKLAADLQPPPDGSPWREFGDWANRLLQEYLARDATDTESTALDRIRRALNEFNTADSIDNAATAAAFREMVNDSLLTPFAHLGPTGQGVFVSSFAAAAGMNFDAVWLVGMIEGAVPPALRPDPLLTEPEWLSAGGRDRVTKRMADERYQYLSVVSGSTGRTLSYPVAHAASQRQAYPSRWFLEQASALESSTVHTGDLPGLRGRDWLSVDDSVEAALNNAATNSLADDHDYRLTRLLRWRQEGRSLLDHPFARAGPLSSAIRLGRYRSQRLLTEFDGNLSSMSDAGRFSVGLRRSPISPTGLEAWATCPYRYFLGHVLGLRALDTPEEIVSLSALDRGTLVHRILETFVRESVEQGALPNPGDPWTAADRDRLMRTAQTLFQAAESQGVTGKRLLWDMDRDTILSDLETYLEEDTRLRSRHGTRSVGVEAAFGFGGDTTDVVDNQTGIRFRGSIDRLDVAEDGSSVLVIDYKTGGAGPYGGLDDDVIDRGRHLQLGVYSLAAQTLYPDASRVEAAYWFSTNRGGFSFAPRDHFHITDDATAQRFRQGVADIVSGINSGLFPANPGPLDRGQPSNCRFCDFDSICPTRRSELWRRKQSDEALSDYLELTGESDGSDS